MAGMVMKFLCVVVVCMVAAEPYAEAALTCGRVVSQVISCLPYLKTGGIVPLACCNGVKGLNSAAKTTPDRKTACTCLKQAYSAYPGLNPELAGGLPGKCGVSIPYKISPNTDCSKVV